MILVTFNCFLGKKLSYPIFFPAICLESHPCLVFRRPVAPSGIGLINGISLSAIALLIAQEAVKHLQTTESVASLPMLLVAGLSLATNGFVVYLLYRHRDRDLNLRGVFLHGVADTASTGRRK